jgi:AhpD family alkylhydroperoxidase
MVTAMFDMAHLWRVGPIRQLAPQAMAGFKARDQAAPAEGAVSKELMAIAAAPTTQRPYCIEAHRKAAIAACSTEAGPAEAVFVATALRAGADLTHGTHLFPD